MFRTISVQQLEYLLDGERTFTLLDVREQREYEAGHLLGAVNLPYERLDEVEAEIPSHRPLASPLGGGKGAERAARIPRPCHCEERSDAAIRTPSQVGADVLIRPNDSRPGNGGPLGTAAPTDGPHDTP